MLCFLASSALIGHHALGGSATSMEESSHRHLEVLGTLVGNFDGPTSYDCSSGPTNITLPTPLYTDTLQIEVTGHTHYPSTRVGVNGYSEYLTITATSTVQA